MCWILFRTQAAILASDLFLFLNPFITKIISAVGEEEDSTLINKRDINKNKSDEKREKKKKRKRRTKNSFS